MYSEEAFARIEAGLGEVVFQAAEILLGWLFAGRMGARSAQKARACCAGNDRVQAVRSCTVMSSKYMLARSPSHRQRIACISLGKRLEFDDG